MPDEENSQQIDSKESDSQRDFMVEKIKERPMNRRRLFRRTLITAAMAVVFGTIACVTFLILEPVISNWLYPEEEPAPIVFPEDQEEMNPEDMLSENIQDDNEHETDGNKNPIEQAQLNDILSNIILNKDNYRQIYSALSIYVAEMNHSIVTVTGVSSNIDWFNNVEESKNQSSGIIIANNGRELLALADYTPLQKADSLTMSFAFLDGNVNNSSSYQVPVTIKAIDNTSNLAVIAVELKDVPPEIMGTGGAEVAELGSSNSKNIIGTPVIAMGSPIGTSGSVGYGIITSTINQSAHADTNYKMLQTDIYGSQNAGGVLFNLQGQVIGIITNQTTSTDMKNMVTAYGITELKKSIEKMSNGEEIAYLGINGIDVTDEAYKEMGVPYGTYVREVEMNSPAMRSGIQQGDVLVAFDERSIRNYNDYITALMQAKTDTAVELKVMREAQGEYREMQITVTTESR